jgi:ankyrin repeat protein
MCTGTWSIWLRATRDAACGLIACASIAIAADDLSVVEAARRQDASAVKALVDAQADVNTRQPDGATALHWAAHWDDIEIASVLIRAGADANARNAHGVTPLSLAAENASARMVSLLVKAGADPNAARVTGETPLMRAVSTGNLAVVETLLAAGANVDASDPIAQQTPLMLAASRRRPAIAKALIARGADVRARSRGGFTPLLFAAREGSVETARLLLAAGADVNEATADGTSALVVATIRGQVPVALFLLEAGADPNAGPVTPTRGPGTRTTGRTVADADAKPVGPDFTALHWAAGIWQTELAGPNGIAVERDEEWRAIRGVPPDEKLALIRALLEKGAEPNARMRKLPPRFGYSQLSYEHGKQGVDVFDGATPFLLAAMAGEAQVMRLLVAGGADPLLTTRDGTTALMVAAGLGRYEAENLVTEARTLGAVTLALELGNDVNRTNDGGNTALHAAAHVKSNELIRLLVDRGAALNVANKRGETPLTVADRFRAGSSVTKIRTSTGDLLRSLGAREAQEAPPK